MAELRFKPGRQAPASVSRRSPCPCQGGRGLKSLHPISSTPAFLSCFVWPMLSQTLSLWSSRRRREECRPLCSKQCLSLVCNLFCSSRWKIYWQHQYAFPKDHGRTQGINIVFLFYFSGIWVFIFHFLENGMFNLIAKGSLGGHILSWSFTPSTPQILNVGFTEESKAALGDHYPSNLD